MLTPYLISDFLFKKKKLLLSFFLPGSCTFQKKTSFFLLLVSSLLRSFSPCRSLSFSQKKYWDSLLFPVDTSLSLQKHILCQFFVFISRPFPCYFYFLTKNSFLSFASEIENERKGKIAITATCHAFIGF